MSSVPDETKTENDEVKAPDVPFLTKLVSNITIEPLVICWLLPFLLTYSAIENLNVEKGCRGFVEDTAEFSKDICKLFVRKDAFDITCDTTNSSWIQDVKFDDIQTRFPDVYESIKNNRETAMNFLCETEAKVQDKMTAINAIRNPIAAIGPLIIILFAGPWSDKKNLRVPCMIIPLLGEAVGYLSLFISAIFIDGPVEFPMYAYRLLPSLTGAENLMVMAIFSYLSACSTAENRTFRFGLFQILMTIVPIIAQSLSPTVNENFEYTQLFGMMIPFHVIGLLYAIFFLKEVKPKVTEESAYDNPALETVIELPNRSNESTLQISEPTVTTVKKTNACLEFFDPRLAIHCIKCFFKRRSNGARSIIILLMLMHFIINGITNGESQNMFYYQRLQLKWDISTTTYHNVFSIVMGLIGTLLMIGLLNKILKISDIVLTLVSTLLSIISKTVYRFATTTVGFFIGTGFDFCGAVKFLSVRSIISRLVPTEDVSTMFAIMGLFEALAAFFFTFAYAKIYKFLLNSENRETSEIFNLSVALLLIAFITYSLVYKLLKTKEKAEEEDEEVEDGTKKDMKSNESTKF